MHKYLNLQISEAYLPDSGNQKTKRKRSIKKFQLTLKREREIKKK
jgi:hypothetical protein